MCSKIDLPELEHAGLAHDILGLYLNIHLILFCIILFNISICDYSVTQITNFKIGFL